MRSFIPSDLVDPQERITELSHLIAILPVSNYTLLRALTAHLISVVQNANVNKMTMRNVGIVFSPTLGIPAGVFSLMLAEFNRVFNVNDDAYEAESAPVEEKGSAIRRVSDASGTDINHRNSKHYLDSTTDQLLGLSGRQLTGT
jgi:RalA-binding protein 1